MFRGSFSIKKTLLIAFLILGTITAGAFFSVYSTFQNDSAQLRLAVTNEMLSQKIAFYTNIHAQGSGSALDIAEQSIQSFDESLAVLRKGGKIVRGGGTEEINAVSEKVAGQIDRVTELWETFKTHVELILEASSEQLTTDSNVASSLNYINHNTGRLLELSGDLSDSLSADLESKKLKANLFFWGGILFLLISFLAGYFFLNSTIVKPLDYFKSKLETLSRGDYEQKVNFSGQKEYNQLAEYLGQVFNKFRLMALYIESIGQGKLDFKIDESRREIVKNDKIFNALERTQSELIKVEKENEIRQWTNEGIRIISELLQKRYDQVQELYDHLVTTIVKYIDGNQGGMFLITGEEDDAQLELVACYAYERKKFLHERFDIEDGLLGQAFKEKNIIYLTEVPENYVRITSGLGRSTPDSVILVPLKDNEAVVGVLELASFGKIEQHRIDFLEKISELIASALNTIIINEKTKALLSESQQQAEEMRAQEEEMRQNMEELQATQEEVQRQMKANEKMQAALVLEKAFLDSIMKFSPDYIYFKDRESKFIRISESMLKIFPVKTLQEMVGKSDFDFVDSELATQYFEEEQNIIKTKKGFVDVIKEEKFENGTSQWSSITKMPLIDREGNCIGTFGITKNITQIKEAEIDAQVQNEEMRAQEEELKQHMEEMTAIQDELEKRAREAENAKSTLELESAMFTSLMNVLNDRITIKDKNGAYIRVNKVKEDSMRKMGVTDYAGKTDADIFDEEHYKKSIEVERKIMESGKGTLNEENKTVMKDGKVLWGQTSRIPFKNRQGEVLGTLVVTRDVTNEKVCAEKLELAEQELKKLRKKS